MIKKDYKNLNDYQSPKWGFYLLSEILNGRIAMFALFIIISIEVYTKTPLINQLSFLLEKD
uniref:hypothetical protein n=1 Tax=Microzonia abyssicola TaxID=217214 RepID=UPI002E7836B9|nr:hypothetical protein V2497_pgp020 [Syringoderma abyssicola]WAM65069.1 hypothetical protein [Syringoderma abyssicola]